MNERRQFLIEEVTNAVEMTLEQRMKSHEARTIQILPRDKPFCVRIDGRSFSRFTKTMTRPFCSKLANVMDETARYLFEITSADYCFTQSDEINLLYDYSYSDLATPMFGGKVMKIVSILAASATAKFITEFPKYYQTEEYVNMMLRKLPHFDARVFSLPSKSEAANVISWRQIDAKRNSVSMLARAHFSHGELQKVNVKEMKKMLSEIGHSWEDMPSRFKYGMHFYRDIETNNPIADDDLDFITVLNKEDFTFSLDYPIFSQNQIEGVPVSE